MKNESYIESFKKFAEENLEKSTSFQQMVGYAYGLTEKVKEILMTASFKTDHEKDDLQKMLHQTGSEYIRKFGDKFRNYGQRAEGNIRTIS